MRSVLAAALLVATVAGCERGEPGGARLVVLILVDTLRADHLSAYGGTVPTPNVDRLSDGGQVFTNATASFHQTSMSMGALFTGRAPSIESEDPEQTLPWNERTWCGLARFSREDSGTPCIPNGLDTLGTAMKRAGYRTAGVVSNYFLFRPAGFDRGFDDWVEVGPRPRDLKTIKILPPESHRAELVTRAAFELLDRDRAGPLFLYLHYMDVHDYKPRPDGRPAARLYAEAVARFDQSLGSLLDGLEARDRLHDRVVILASDHGEALGERHVRASLPKHLGNPSFQPVLRIPLIISPHRTENPARFLRSQDLFDLILEIAGARSLARDPDLEPDELYLSEFAYQTHRRGRWKTIRRRSDGRTWLLDLEEDPEETRDESGARPDLVASNLARLNELAARLATRHEVPDVLSDDARERLRALGYAE